MRYNMAIYIPDAMHGHIILTWPMTFRYKMMGPALGESFVLKCMFKKEN